MSLKGEEIIRRKIEQHKRNLLIARSHMILIEKEKKPKNWEKKKLQEDKKELQESIKRIERQLKIIKLSVCY